MATRTCGTGGSLNCNDLLSAIIQAILDLKGSSGSSADEILSYLPSICPGAASTTLDEVNIVLAFGARTGSLFRAIASPGATPTYMIKAYMVNFNVQNRPYARNPCQQHSFFKSSTIQA